MSLSDLLLKYIRENGLTYESFAQRCNLSKGYVSMLINNRNPKTGKPPIPTIETYLNIAEAMGTTVGELLAITEKDTPTYYHNISASYSPEEMRLIKAYRSALPVIRDAAMKMLEDNPNKKGGGTSERTHQT